jgi:hypothetical protein
MSKSSGRHTVRRDAKTGSFVVDRGYLKAQAKEAVVTFLTPVSGVYKAATRRPKTVTVERVKERH